MISSVRRWVATWKAWSGDERRALVAAVVLNSWMRWTLRHRGTQAALARVRRLGHTRQRVAATEATDGAATLRRAKRLGAVVNRAAAPPAPHATCLARSLALQVLLHRRGIPGELRIGVRPRTSDDLDETPGTLLFHAWIELDAVPVNDRLDVAEQYAVFPLDQLTSAGRFD